MDFQTIIAIIAILTTIIFGLPAFISLKQQKRTRILFIKESEINFYQKILKGFDNIIIKYKNNDVNKGMFVLRGFFYCLGRKDVKKQDIEYPLNIELIEENAIWHDCKLIACSKDLNPILEIRQNKLDFNFNLLKGNDFIYFEALGESDQGNYSIEHRIADVPDVEKDEIKTFKSFKEIVIWMIFLIVFFGWLFIDMAPWKIDRFNIDVEFYNSKNEIVPIDTVAAHTYAIKETISEAEKGLAPIRQIEYLEEIKIKYPDSFSKKYNIFDISKIKKAIPISDGYVLKLNYPIKWTFWISIIAISCTLIFTCYILILLFLYFRRFRAVYKKFQEIIKTVENKGSAQ